MMPKDKGSDAAELEHILPYEAEQIKAIVKATEKQLRNRYADKPAFLRGVHPKAHGCVDATFTVLKNLRPEYRVGVFAQPGRQYRAQIRFSNAATLVEGDSPADPQSGKRAHGSRGMAVKLHNVGGTRLVPGDGEDTQDFLMINQPVFAFANVEDYAVLSQVIADNDKNASEFFKMRILRDAAKNPMMFDPGTARAAQTGYIIECIRSLSEKFDPPPPPPPGSKPTPPPPHAFQAPPTSPLDNRYFSAAPFGFGEGWVAKFGANPVSPPEPGDLGEAINDDDYLRAALNRRLSAGQDIEFEFLAQRRSVADIKDIDTEIENACTLWNEKDHPFVPVATITIKPQDINGKGQREACDKLEFSPWHGLVDHRPLGSINRLRRAVYEKSVALRR
jgi:hypothetical protein